MNEKKWLLALHFASFCAFYLLISSCLSADTIPANGYLTGNQTIISANGQFELGFFKPGKTPKYYIGIWYKKIPGQIVIWVANRDNPASDKHTSKLRLLNDGNLVVVCNGCKSPIWSTNMNYRSSKPVLATLLDDGNLVLRDGSNSNPPLWQSFEHPTNSFMPGSKFGVNKLTKSSISFTSWKNSEDPGTGFYTYEHDPNADQLIMLWNKTEQYWSSGLWIPEQQIFSEVPERRFTPWQVSFDYVDNENESYMTFSLHDTSLVTRFVMDVSGQFRDYNWKKDTQEWILLYSQPGQQCEVYSYCGVFAVCDQSSMPYCNCLQGFKPNSEIEWDLKDYSKGCARKAGLSCKGGKDGDKFVSNPSKVLPQNPHSISASTRVECESACLSNCSCSAYAFDDDGCFVWFSELLNMRRLSDSSGKTLSIRVAASEVQTRGDKKLVVGISVGLVVGLVALFGLGFGVYWRGKRRLLVAVKTMEHSLARFGYKDLQSATSNFCHKLGSGGFGSVFKGILPDSTVVAVKKLESVNDTQGEKQFRAEVSAIGTVQHINLVRLRGFCSEGSKKLLVYEYMPNGSLNTHLFQRENSKILGWDVRYQIAIGIARGLAYLHEKCRDCIIHCDIKPENVLLDANFCPKVADFGLAKLVGREFSRVLTTIRGTRGYLAPEWISGEAITAKADVYSYGMMLFELVSGRRNIYEASDGRLEFFPTWAMSTVLREDDVLSIIDPQLDGVAEKEEVVRICKLACWCIQDNENQRPSMGQAVQVLERFLDIEIPPIPQPLQVFADNGGSLRFFTELSSNQYSTEDTVYASASSVNHNTPMSI
ncbi:unnamed protein product [Amaranthus hypochondriacus]